LNTPKVPLDRLQAGIVIFDLATAAIAVGAFVNLWRFRLSPGLVILLGGLTAALLELARI
jgi:hypothetical protein